MARHSSSFSAVLLLGLVALGFAATSAAAAPANPYATFLAALQADRIHHLLMLNAAGKDPATTALLKQPNAVTALVPTDAAFVKAATALKGNGSVSMTQLLASPCVVRAILDYHTVRPGKKLADIATNTTVKTLFQARTTVAGKVSLAPRYLRFVKVAGGATRVVGGATSGTIVAPYDVPVVGGGVLHNVDTLLLPTTNLTRLLEITGCAL